MSYRVVLAGSVVAGVDIGEVRRKLMQATGQSEAVVLRLLSGSPNVIKRGLSRAEADRILGMLREMGAVASLEDEAPAFTIDDPSPASQQPSVGEKTSHRVESVPALAAFPMHAVDAAGQVAGDRGTPSTPAYLAERGAVAAPDTGAQLTDEAMYLAIIGRNNADKYLPYFLARDAGGGFFSWHWPCLFVQFGWALYRKCWGFAFGGLVLAVILAMVAGGVAGFVLALLGVSDKTIETVGNVIGWVGAAVVATTAKGFYHRKARTIINGTSHIRDPNARVAEIARRGGTSMAWVWLLVAIPLIGILAAIAIPAYDDYVKRSRELELRRQSQVQEQVQGPVIDLSVLRPTGKPAV